MPDHLSQAAYAAHRRKLKLPGVARQTVERALADGRIHLEPDGKIDPVRCDREWEENTLSTARSESSQSLADSRADRAQTEARRARLDLQKQEGQLAEVATMKLEWFAMTRQVRDRLQAVPARLAGELAAETDARAVEQRIDMEIREALQGLMPGTNGKG